MAKNVYARGRDGNPHFIQVVVEEVFHDRARVRFKYRLPQTPFVALFTDISVQDIGHPTRQQLLENLG